MATARFVSCTGCHAEVSDDREACPHCGEEIKPYLETQAEQSNDENVRRLTDEVIKLERYNDSLLGQVDKLTHENAELRSQNDELRRQVGQLPPKEHQA